MEYSLHFDSEALDFLKKLNKDLTKRIWDKLIIAKHNPHHFFVRLEGRKEFKLRVGDYRVIADIDDKNKLVEIRFIGHRKNIYARC